MIKLIMLRSYLMSHNVNNSIYKFTELNDSVFIFPALFVFVKYFNKTIKYYKY